MTTTGIGGVGSTNAIQTAPSSVQGTASDTAFDELLAEIVDEMMLQDTVSLASSIGQGGDGSDGMDGTDGSSSSSSLLGSDAQSLSFSSIAPLLSMLPNYSGTAGAATDTATATSPGLETASPDGVEALVASAASKYNLPSSLLNAVIQQESGFEPDAVSSAGAIGLMQLMPSTAESLGIDNPLDPAQNINGGAKYLSQLLKEFDGSVPLALAAYNAGPNAVKSYGGVPPYSETQQYVQNILAMSGLTDTSTI